MPFRTSLVAARIAIALALFARGSFAAPLPTGDDAFETEIRPLLIAHCGKCHGPEKHRGGLRLDSRESMLEGGDSGAAIVPGRPADSLLLSAVRHDGDLKMPPDRKLRDDQIEALERWVEAGPPGRSPRARRLLRGTRAWRRHWAFQPVGDPVPPTRRRCRLVPQPDRPLRAAGARGRGAGAFAAGRSPHAHPEDVVRPDGPPAHPDEVDAFVADPDPDAYAKLVDAAPASAHYGEQWARHWLDVARYSDTKGYVYAREEAVLRPRACLPGLGRAGPSTRTSRTTGFLLLQIAADQAAPEERPALAAMGFLTLGRRFLGVTHDIIDDRIDVVTRGTMGLSVACARCHDHKYDPIPTGDYYALYGVFQNGTERLVPIAEPAARDEAYRAFETELERRQKLLKEALDAGRAEASTRARDRLAEYLLAQRELEKFPQEGFDQVLSKTDLIPAFVRRWEAISPSRRGPTTRCSAPGRAMRA
jgi:cytochrome c553